MESRSTTARNVGLVVGGFFAICVAIWRGFVADRQAKASAQQVLVSHDQAQAALQQAETSQRVLLNERYQKGAEMLGSKILSVRLGGIYALQRLAEDNPEHYHVQIMRLLCAFVRNPTKDKDRDGRIQPAENEERGTRNIKACVKALMIPDDVQAAMEAISTRSEADVELEKKEKFEPDLSGAQLSGIDLSKQKANLSGVDLSNVVFAIPELMPLNMSIEETLELPRITAILSGADLRRAKLDETDLTDANLTGVDLRGVKGITQEQLNLARAYSTNSTKVDPPLKPPRNKPYTNFIDRLAGERRSAFDRLERERP